MEYEAPEVVFLGTVNLIQGDAATGQDLGQDLW